MPTIDSQVKKQEEEKKNKIYQDNSTDAERTIYDKLKKIVVHFRDNIFPEWFEDLSAYHFHPRHIYGFIIW